MATNESDLNMTSDLTNSRGSREATPSGGKPPPSPILESEEPVAEESTESAKVSVRALVQSPNKGQEKFRGETQLKKKLGPMSTIFS